MGQRLLSNANKRGATYAAAETLDAFPLFESLLTLFSMCLGITTVHLLRGTRKLNFHLWRLVMLIHHPLANLERHQLVHQDYLIDPGQDVGHVGPAKYVQIDDAVARRSTDPCDRSSATRLIQSVE